MILYGTKEAPARMVRQITSGKKETFVGETITHNRLTGVTTVDGTTSLQGEIGLRPPGKGESGRGWQTTERRGQVSG